MILKRKFTLINYEQNFSYVFSAPGKLLESMPGTLMLTDCLEACQSNDSCRAVNYETGLCVLFSSDSDKLPGNLICRLLSIQYKQGFKFNRYKKKKSSTRYRVLMR